MCRSSKHVNNIDEEPSNNPELTSEDSYDDDEVNSFIVFTIDDNNKGTTFPVIINNTTVPILIDSGSSINLIDEETYSKIIPKLTLTPSKSKIFAYQAQTPLKLLGEFNTVIQAGEQYTNVSITVIQGKGKSILSKTTAEKLDLLRVGPPLSKPINHLDETQTVDTILAKHKEIFEGHGLLKNTEIKLHIDPEATPIATPLRRIPWHTRQKVSAELKRLQQLDIIEKYNGPTTWLNPYVVVPRKSSDQIRLCLDMRKANEAITRERHVIPKFDEILPELHNATVFSKIDLREGYHQLLLHPDSRDITTFATHEGIFRYKRLIFGINSAFEIFQKKIELVITDCPGAKNISDDILIWGSTQEEHDKNLTTVLQRLLEHGLRLNREKCIFSVYKLIFAGHLLTANGIKPDQAKTDAILHIKPPTNVTEVRSFLGLVNFCNRFIKDFATISEPIRRLTRKKQPFIWKLEQQTAFDKLKQALQDPQIMAYYNPNAKIKLIVDASPFGLGGILSQRQPDGEFKVVSYGSRALTDVESRYSQTEREALAVHWALEHFHYYIFDTHVMVISDHKPLETLLSPRSSPPPRIQRWLLKMQAYDYTIVYEPGYKNAADMLSRNPKQQSTYSLDTDTTHYVNMVTAHATPVSVNLDQISKETAKDHILPIIITSLRTGKWNKTAHRRYYSTRFNLSVTDTGILLKNHRIVIPTSLRQSLLHIAHRQHLGQNRTKEILREKVWWPGMSTEVETLVKSCPTCQIVTPTKRIEPLQPTEMPSEPWQTIGADLKGPLPSGEHILVLLDYKTRFPITFIMKRGITSSEIIRKISKSLSLFGYPDTIITDNGSQFISHEFTNFLNQHRIKHRTVSPYWPQANGEVERFNRTLTKILQCATTEQKDWRKELQKFLLSYRTTPHPATGKSPADMMFQHKPQNDIPSYKQTPAKKSPSEYATKMKIHTDTQRKAKVHDKLNVGDTVLVKNFHRKNKTEPFYETEPYHITKVYDRSVKVQQHQKVFVRNNAHIKPFITSHYRQLPEVPVHKFQTRPPIQNPPILITLEPDDHRPDSDIDSDAIPELDESYSDIDTNDDTIPYREELSPIRPHRNVRLPNRYDDYEMNL